MDAERVRTDVARRAPRPPRWAWRPPAPGRGSRAPAWSARGRARRRCRRAPGARCMARCEPSPNAMPCSSATCASAWLISAASLGAAGHPGDEERRPQPLAEERRRRRRPRDRELRERVVHEVDLFEERRLAGVLHLALLAEIEVRALAIADRLSQRRPPARRWRRGAAGCRRPARRRAPPRPGPPSVASAMPQSPPPAPDGLAAAPTRCAARTSVASAGVTSGRSSSSPSRTSSEAERSSASSSVAASPRATASAAAVATAVRSASAAGGGRGREADEQRRRVRRGSRSSPRRGAGRRAARARAPRGRRDSRRASIDAAVHGGGDVGAAALARLEERVRLERAREQLGARCRPARARPTPRPAWRRCARARASARRSGRRASRRRRAARAAGSPRWRIAASTAPGVAPGQRSVCRGIAPGRCGPRRATPRPRRRRPPRSRPRRDGRRPRRARARRAARPTRRSGRACPARVPVPSSSRTSQPSTSAPLPGAHVSTRSTPGTAPSASAICGASSGRQSTFTCGPASMVTNAGTPSARSDHTRWMHSTVAPRQ